MRNARYGLVLAGTGLMVLYGCGSTTPGAGGGEPDSGGGKPDTGGMHKRPPHEAGMPDVTPRPKDAGHDTSTAIPYPKGPYGTKVGAVLDPSLTWEAYAPGATSSTTIHISDFYDPDGKKGVNALVIDTSGQWCVACQYEAQSIPDWMGSTAVNAGHWTSLGVNFLTLIIQNNAYQPATITTAEQWRAMFSLQNAIFVAADPNDSLPAVALPHNVLVDPRTMTIVRDLDSDPTFGSTSPDPAVAALATKNHT